MSNWLIDPTQRLLTSALDGLSLREQAVAANLSNIDTPGYRAESVSFESELQAQLASAMDGGHLALNPPSSGPSAALGLAQTSAGHFSGLAETGAPIANGALDQASPANSMRVDGNTVNVDEQMTALAETQVKYAAVSRMLSGKVGMLRDVVTSR